jgi:hypothetical protein
MNPEATGELLEGIRSAVKGRMIPRLKFVGSSPATKDQIEGSFLRQLENLERHLASRPFLFGGRPAFGDFGLFAQLYECSSDPTPGAIIRARAPRVLGWIERMLAPEASGTGSRGPRSTHAPPDAPRRSPRCSSLDGGQRSCARRRRQEFTVQLGGKPFTQETQKYRAVARGARARYAAVADRSTLDPLLERAGCRRWLAAG